jgi:hypothetical protein
MGQSYAKNRVHILKWREDNREQYNQIGKLHMKKVYAFKKECLRLNRMVLSLL